VESLTVNYVVFLVSSVCFSVYFVCKQTKTTLAEFHSIIMLTSLVS